MPLYPTTTHDATQISTFCPTGYPQGWTSALNPCLGAGCAGWAVVGDTPTRTGVPRCLQGRLRPNAVGARVLAAGCCWCGAFELSLSGSLALLVRGVRVLAL